MRERDFMPNVERGKPATYTGDKKAKMARRPTKSGLIWKPTSHGTGLWVPGGTKGNNSASVNISTGLNGTSTNYTQADNGTSANGTQIDFSFNATGAENESAEGNPTLRSYSAAIKYTPASDQINQNAFKQYRSDPNSVSDTSPSDAKREKRDAVPEKYLRPRKESSEPEQSRQEGPKRV
ncbi:hypothetical protein Baya_14734 [Bagarius yarrelli]|uniref:Uncharacterized protein n=1 Tax=Bagarius yarrelli TaxID=175774 RepID=A0A556VA63_BAGYA|nr:hypothetical protein Baya_14734 [Bagarius yarrelli]